MKQAGFIKVVLIFSLGVLYLLLSGVFAQDITDHLLIHYPFAGNANDAGWHGFHGSPHATLATDRLGNTNSCYFFDGVDILWILPTMPS